jgi:hypothetical protein
MHHLETHLSAVWNPAYQDVWLLISDRPAGGQRIAEYAWRARVEATFQDGKSRGWKLEASRIADRSRLERLLLVLFLGLWWVAHLAAACIHHGHRQRFDRHDRRDKGIFRLGRLWLLDILRRAKDAGVILRCLPFCRQGTSLSLCFALLSTGVSPEKPEGSIPDSPSSCSWCSCQQGWLSANYGDAPPGLIIY